jgi:hypothetical protein
MLTGLLETFKGLLNRSFWFGLFLPVAIVAFLHAILLATVFPDLLSLDSVFDVTASEAAGKFGMLLILLVVAAYAVAPFINLFVEILDGSVLPERLHNFLRRRRIHGWKDTRAKFETAKNDLAAAEALERKWKPCLQEKAAARLNEAISDPKAIIDADNAIAACETGRWSRITDDLKAIEIAAEAVAAALDRNTTTKNTAHSFAGEWAARLAQVRSRLEAHDPPSVGAGTGTAAAAVPPGASGLPWWLLELSPHGPGGGTPAGAASSPAEPPAPVVNLPAIEAAELALDALDGTSASAAALAAARTAVEEAERTNTLTPDAAEAFAERLDRAHIKVYGLLTARTAESRHCRDALRRRGGQFNLHNLEATRLGDARRTLERYSSEAYGADLDWLWPRLEHSMPADAAATARLEASKAQLDFTVLLIALIQTVPLAWLPILLLSGGSRDLVVLIAWTWPLASAGLYEAVVRAQIAFGSVVETTIDRHRFALLDSLHQPRPETLAAERELWRRLGRITTRGHGVNLVYRRSTQETAQ